MSCPHVNPKTFFLSFLFVFLAIANTSFSMIIGKDGSFFEENGILWQPVRFEENKNGFKAVFPGKTKSGISQAWCYIQSKYNKTVYEIHTHLKDRFEIPVSNEDFLSMLKELVEENEEFYSIDISNSQVSHAAEVLVRDKETGNLNKIWRIFWTFDQRVYYAIIEGKDLSLADEFFNKIVFTSS